MPKDVIDPRPHVHHFAPCFANPSDRYAVSMHAQRYAMLTKVGPRSDRIVGPVWVSRRHCVPEVLDCCLTRADLSPPSLWILVVNVAK